MLIFLTIIGISTPSLAKQSNTKSGAMVVPQVLEKAKKNNYWKVAFATARNGQVVFMDISPSTNPINEIGMETHPFDQVILLVEGNAKAVLNGKETKIKAGDMLFIPQGTKHNVINLSPLKPLKIISFYSGNDIPANSIYKKKSDEYKK